MSLAKSVNVPLLRSNKKQSKMGMVLLEFKTPFIDFKCFNKVDDDTTKFIGLVFNQLKFNHMESGTALK